MRSLCLRGRPRIRSAAVFLVLLLLVCCFLTVEPRKDQSRVLVLYAFFEKNSDYAETLRFFLSVGVRPNDHVDYIFILQGPCSVPIPSWRNVMVYQRENTCFDFGAYGATFAHLGGLAALSKRYRAVIFLNPSVVGPILPKYWPKTLHWSVIFTDRLMDGVEVVGTSLVCLPPSDAGGHGPRIEGMAWAASFRALEAAASAGAFRCYDSKVDAIVEGEYGLSRAALSAGMNLDSLLLMYGSIDWRDKRNWACNSNKHPTRNGSYDGISVHPLEVVFHKPQWHWEGKITSQVYHNELLSQYMPWALQRAQL